MFRTSMARVEAAMVADLEIESVETYLKEEKRGAGEDWKLQLEITSIITEKIRKPKGNIWVTVTILNKHPFKSRTYAYPLQTRGRVVVRRDR